MDLANLWQRLWTAALMTVLVFLQSFLITWELCWTRMIKTHVRSVGWTLPYANQDHGPDLFVRGVVVLCLHWAFWLGFAIPCFFAQLHGWIFCRWLPLVSAPARPNMEVDGPESTTRRFCEPCGIYQEDRTRHSWHGITKRCLPVLDHFCDYINAPIYAGNLKAYILFLINMALYQIVSVGIVVYGLVDSGTRSWAYIPGLVLMILSTPLFIRFAYRMTLHLVVRNLTDWDLDKSMYYRISLPGEGVEFTFAWRNGQGFPSPWDQGSIARNIRVVLGPWWQWLAVWRPSPLMTSEPRYGAPFLQAVRDGYLRAQPTQAPTPPPPTSTHRRRDAHSSGVELEEFGGAVRQRHRTSTSTG